MNLEILNDLASEAEVQTTASLFKHKHLPVTKKPGTADMGCTCLDQDYPTCYSQTILVTASISSGVAAFVLGCIVTYVWIRRLRFSQRRTEETSLDEEETSDADSKNGGEFHINHPELYESGRYVSINDSREHTYESMRKIVYKPNNRHGEDECMDYLPLRNVQSNRVSELGDGIVTIENSDEFSSGEDKENEAANHDYFILEPLERNEPDDVRWMEGSSNEGNENLADVYVDTNHDYQMFENKKRTDAVIEFEDTYESYGEYETAQTRSDFEANTDKRTDKEIESEDTYENYDEYERTQTQNDFEGNETVGFEDRENTAVHSRPDENSLYEGDYTDILLEDSGRFYSGLTGQGVSNVKRVDYKETGIVEDEENELYEDENLNVTYQNSDIYSIYDSEMYIVNYNDTSPSDLSEAINTGRKESSSSMNVQDDSVFLDDDLPDTLEKKDIPIDQSKIYRSEDLDDTERRGSATSMFKNDVGEEKHDANILLKDDNDVKQDGIEYDELCEQDEIHVGGTGDNYKNDCLTRKESHVYININQIEGVDEYVNRDVV